MYRFVILVAVCITIAACQSEPFILLPTQGPAVLGDGTEIIGWEYLSPDMIGDRPQLLSLSAETQKFESEKFDRYKYEVWLLPTENGFKLEWGQFMCATQPVAVVHSNQTIEFWPGEIVGESCDAMSVSHQLTVTLADDMPAKGWKVIVHPPPLSE